MKNQLWGSLKLLNPKNLQKEVHIYGYHFSWKVHIFLMLGALGGISAVGVLFQLKPVFFWIVLLAVVCVLPVLVLDMYRKMYEQKRFGDAAAYMEQMLYSFQKTGKVMSALKESREIFDEGQMRRVIDEAISYLERGKTASKDGLLQESLRIIEETYSCTKIHMVHGLLINAEEYGGAVDDSIMLVLEDIERWKRRGYQLQAEKKVSHTDNMVSIAVATILCAVALYVLDAMKEMFAVESTLEIFQVQIIQISSVVFILFLLLVFVKSARNLTDDWLQENTLHEPGYIADSYDMIMQYDEKKAQKKSIVLAVLPLILSMVFLFLGKTALGICGLAVTAVFLVQHKVGYRLAKKDVTEEMYLALPQWFTEMALLLQHNNVQVSIAKSMDAAPEVLKKELSALTIRLQGMPGKLQAYTDFCKEFDLPETQSCMKMLHAVSENGTGNVQVQMNHLLARVGEMQGLADDIENKRIAFRMKMLFSYPVIASTVKLLLDLTVGMVLMMQLLARVGGM